MRIPSFAGLIALLLLAPTARASETYWLDVVAYPPIPGAVRHLQTIHTVEADGPEADMLGRGQHATELMTADVEAIAQGLVAWTGGAEPPNHTIWKRQVGGYFLEFTSRMGADRHVIVSSTAIATTPGRGCRGCYGVVVFGKQQMPVSEGEVLDLIERLNLWLSGENPPDAIVWSKLRVIP